MKNKKISKLITKKIFSLCRYVFFIAFSFIILYPFIYIVVNALKGVSDFTDPVVQWVPKEIEFGNFPLAVKVFDMWKSIGNTLVIEIVASLLQFCSCAVAAYGLARFDFKGKKILLGIMIVNIIVRSVILITPSYVNYRWMNILDTPWAFYLPSILGVGLKGGFFIFIFTQFYKKLPRELEEAAWVDGAGPWRTFFSIAVPNSGPAAITVLLFSLVWHWNDFYLSQMFNSSNPTFSAAINSFSQNTVAAALGVDQALGKSLAIPILLAGCLLFVLPLVVLYAFIQKKFIASVTTSGITG